jgi:hypothetical protein
MGQRIVGHQDPWWSGCGQLLLLLITGATLCLILAWINWPR